MTTRPQLHRFRLFGLLAIAAGIQACGAAVPSGRFATFAEGTRAIASNSVVTYAGVIDLQRTYMLYNPNGDALSETSFDAAVVGDDGTVQSFDFEPRLAFRSAALDVLADYADALHAFATKDYQEDLDAATQSLGASVANLASLAGGTSAAQAGGILATAVNGMGRAAIEHLRRQTLRDAMDTAQSGVDTLATLIATDNTKIALAVRTMRRGVLRKANKLRPATGISRVAFDAGVQTIIIDSGDTLKQLDAMNAAVTKIPPAHADIRRSLDDRGSSLDQLRAMIAEAKRLNKYYRTTVGSSERKS